MDKKTEIIRSIKFTLFSASAGIIQFASFAFFEEILNISHWLAYLISLVLSVLWNFTLNRKFTFCSANNIPVAMFKVAIFYAVFTPLSTWWTAWFTDGCGINEYIVVVATMLVNFITEYLYDRFIVFGKTIDTAKKSENA